MYTHLCQLRSKINNDTWIVRSMHRNVISFGKQQIYERPLWCATGNTTLSRMQLSRDIRTCYENLIEKWQISWTPTHCSKHTAEKYAETPRIMPFPVRTRVVSIKTRSVLSRGHRHWAQSTAKATEIIERPAKIYAEERVVAERDIDSCAPWHPQTRATYRRHP